MCINFIYRQISYPWRSLNLWKCKKLLKTLVNFRIHNEHNHEVNHVNLLVRRFKETIKNQVETDTTITRNWKICIKIVLETYSLNHEGGGGEHMLVIREAPNYLSFSGFLIKILWSVNRNKNSLKILLKVNNVNAYFYLEPNSCTITL